MKKVIGRNITKLYKEYLERDGYLDREKEEALDKFSMELDEKVSNKSITHEDLARYEELARDAAFHAGFHTALHRIRKDAAAGKPALFLV